MVLFQRIPISEFSEFEVGTLKPFKFQDDTVQGALPFELGTRHSKVVLEYYSVCLLPEEYKVCDMIDSLTNDLTCVCVCVCACACVFMGVSTEEKEAAEGGGFVESLQSGHQCKLILIG